MESVRDKSIIIKQEAKTIEDILNDYKGLESMYAIEKCMRQIKKTSEEGIEQILRCQQSFCNFNN